ncbi:MAG: DEAD/DEAH box helicase [Nocardioidaceae bacterium]|nr:DEAD/DEAH box helicase [Nocardioidaceae bacterium]
MSSPAGRYARFRADQQRPALAEFRGGYDFRLDTFQVRACEELEDGHGVLVAAPTGSGKTLVGEFAVHLALERGLKCFYTTPIKALSNQKYADLVRRHGADRVGLLTGDNVVNGDASVVVMTTEVLRNMLYAGSGALVGLGFVVMDEVHYLADRFRGAVWEEVIIHLPESVSVVSLSATVSNAEEFGDWLSEVRGDTVTVVEERRPVPLFQHVMVGRRLLDLFADADRSGAVRVNPELERVARDDLRAGRVQRSRGARPGRGSYARPGARSGTRSWTPSRVEVVDRLDRAGLLPAIVFVFSRAGCAAAVEQVLAARLNLTTAQESAQIRAHVDNRCARLPDADLQTLGYGEFVEGLARGVACHHAGMLPTFKEVVEELFTCGLVKVVFATETLALGINMPARSVVIERLSKWNGETHADITPGEYTQLTGRAGRRGIDVEGHGVVLWQPGLDPKAVGGLASTRTYPLRSSFRPSYNMAVNLVRQVGRAPARAMLEQSFAQFQTDRAVVGLARQLSRAEEALAGYAESASCDRGDFLDYAGLRRALSEREAQLAKRQRHDDREVVVESLEQLRPGDVIWVPSGRWAGPAVVVDPGSRSDRDGPRPLVLTTERQARRLSMIDFPTPVEATTRMRVPKAFDSRNPQQRRDLASSLRHAVSALPADSLQPRQRRRRGPARGTVDDDERLRDLRARSRAHPCHVCPRRDDHARWAERWTRLDRDTANLRRSIEQRTNTIARQYDRVCDVLDRLGYLSDDEVTPAGARLARIYAELDLLAAECLREGVWEGLSPAELAGALSGLVYETRTPDEAEHPRLPRGRVRDVVAQTTSLWARLERLEHEHGLSTLHRPDFGFCWAAWRWADRAALDDVLYETELAAGDFVRWVKQIVDLADQVADAAGDGPLRRTARETVAGLRRGVVAYTSVSA